jgi:hypothetical protein
MQCIVSAFGAMAAALRSSGARYSASAVTANTGRASQIARRCRARSASPIAASPITTSEMNRSYSPAVLPPVAGELLIAQDHNVSTQPANEITDDARLQLYTRLHMITVADSKASGKIGLLLDNRGGCACQKVRLATDQQILTSRSERRTHRQLVTRVAREIRLLEQALKATNARTTVDAYDQFRYPSVERDLQQVVNQSGGHCPRSHAHSTAVVAHA